MKLFRCWLLVLVLGVGSLGHADDEWDAFVEEQKKIYEGMQSPELKTARAAFRTVVEGLDVVVSAAHTIHGIGKPHGSLTFREEVLRLATRPEHFHDELAVKFIRDWMKDARVELQIMIEEGDEADEDGLLPPILRIPMLKGAIEEIDRAAELLRFSLEASEDEWRVAYRNHWLPICKEWRHQLVLATRRVKTEGTRSREDWLFSYEDMFLDGFERLDEAAASGRRTYLMKTMRGWAVQWEVGGKRRGDGVDPLGDPSGQRRRLPTPR